MKIAPELQAENKVGTDGFPPLAGTHMLVCRIGWFMAFVLLPGQKFFYFGR